MSTNNYNFTKCTLMHKNIPVANIELTKRTGAIVAVTEILNIKHAPLTTTDKNGINSIKLDDWLRTRTIPASRQNITRLMQDLDITTPVALALQSYGLSLSDQYWVRPLNLDVQWEDINFFQNDFSDDIGRILFSEKSSSDPNINVQSPDNTSDGLLPKRWTIQNGKRILIKGHDSKNQLQQEPFNEVIATKIMEKLKINHIPYSQIFIDNKPYSLCENFITEDTELITAWSISRNFKRENHISEYDHLLASCEQLGIKDAHQAIEEMLVLDYLIANTDRHYGNFGFIRNASTLEYQGFAPIYDSGSSLWCGGEIISNIVDSKPFKNRHSSQIKLVTDLSWFQPIPKQELTTIITETLSNNAPITDVRVGISQERIALIAEKATQRFDFVTKLQQELAKK